ncbi:peptidoglycan DD-metalloendopeptidase family protein [Candidatus Parcubacteria bacterium]|nr:peptidoglycan DD-metalloendopeptidase family protein [Patescibacteria group bacterium]MCG2693799.1 peptidoglycan DD-metalloendopeptidase family protein [Candidatus Parcubacteria bacterium]
MRKKLKKLFYCYIVILLAGVLILPNFVFASDKDELVSLSDEINDKKDKLDALEKNLDYYKSQIDTARKSSVTLKNQIDLTENYIKKAELEIQEEELRIDKTELEMLGINNEIDNTQKKSNLQKDIVAHYLREINRLSSKSSLEIILIHPSFSLFFSEVKYFEDLQTNLSTSLKNLKDLQSRLEDKQKELKQKKDDALQLKSDLEDTKSRLEAQKTAKTFLIGQTFASESKFQALLMDAQKEQRDLDAEISRMEKNIREKLEANDLFPYGGTVVFTWPTAKNKITAYFHDPDYPFRYLYEHPGIDIRAAQGTQVAAPAPGYVLKVRNQNSSRVYNYVVLVHAGGLSTVYIHLSQVYVEPDTYVSRGDIIGKSGGTPGTRGAGMFTTGPHLHFEIRLNGIPVNPLDYLVNL